MSPGRAARGIAMESPWEPGLACEDVRHGFVGLDGSRVEALEGVSFRAGAHEFLCLVGPSGCGKTTLLKLIAGLLTPDAGRIVTALDRDRAGDRVPLHALVFQEHGVFPWLTVRRNVAFGLEMQGTPADERRARVEAFIERVGLERFADAYPHELSVGMRQRVGIARAFVSDAPILLMDEPFGSLDAQTKLLLQDELLRIWKQDRKLVLFVTHDIEEAARLGDRVLVMTGRPGRIREEITIPMPRPRDAESDRRQIAEITWHIWQLLRDEAQRAFATGR